MFILSLFLLLFCFIFTGCPGIAQKVPTPTFSIDPGTYDDAEQILYISCSEYAASIYYTIDGSTPTEDSIYYHKDDVIILDHTMTVKAIATMAGMANSDIAEASYTITKVATPVISPEEGSYPENIEVSLSCVTPDATIYYTTDGSVPTSSSTLYTNSFTLDHDATVKAIALKSGLSDSNVKSKNYHISTPVILSNDTWKNGSIGEWGEIDWFYFEAIGGKKYNIWWDDSYQGSHTYTCDIKVSAYREDKTTSYFTNIDSGYNTPKVITAAATERVYIKIQGYYTTGTYAVRYKYIESADDPVFNPTAGEYDEVQSVAISSTTPGSAIYYTINGSNPTTGSTQYTSPITISTSTTIKAIATKAGIENSNISTAIYTINRQLATEDTYISATLDATGEIDWFYFNATAGNSYKIWWDDSYQGSGTYTCDIKVSAYREDKITSYFTNINSAYSNPKIITASATEKVYIKVEGYYSSSKGTYAVKYKSCITPPSFSPDGNSTYSTSQNVTISCTTPGVTIYYTTDGSTPTTSSNIYTTPITIFETTILKAFAVKAGLPDSEVTSQTFYIVPYQQAPFTSSYYGQKGDKWTIMIYLDGANNLESAALDDLNEMEYGLYLAKQSYPDIENNINIIVLLDRISGYSSSYTEQGETDWTNSRIYKIKPDPANSSYFLSTTIENCNDVNMGNPNTLKSFINWSKTQFPANKYSLILWNHGGGARAKSFSKSLTSGSSEKAVCWDDESLDDCLYLDEVQDSINNYFNSGNKLDLLGFDACLMGTVEVAYEFRDLASYMVASMHTEQGDGWDYEYIIKHIAQSLIKDSSGGNDQTTTAGNPTAEELAKIIVFSYENYIEKSLFNNNTGETMAAIDLANISSTNLKAHIDNLAVKIYNENKKSSIENIRDASIHFYSSDEDSISYPYFDLYDLCNRIKNDAGFSTDLKNAADQVITDLSSLIVWAYGDIGNGQSYYFGSGTSVKRGLSIFFSRGNLTYSGYSHYWYQWWYTNMDTNWWSGGHYYGFIDFADSDTDNTVETWRELMEAWYDPNDLATPGAW
jgi:clostripain